VPSTLSERWVFVLGLAVVAALVALIVPAWREYSRGEEDAEPNSALVNAEGQLRPTSAPGVIPLWAVELRRWWLNDRVGQRPSGAPIPPPAWFWDWNAWKSGIALRPPPPVRARPDRIALVLRAATGDSWLEVRLDSESGPIRYFGTLRRGKSLRVSGPQVWIRAGIADNLVALLNGEPVGELPRGVATFLVTPDGIQTLAAE
jgi:uncharacterized protein DUF4115